MAVWALGRLCAADALADLAHKHTRHESDKDVAAEWRAVMRGDQ